MLALCDSIDLAISNENWYAALLAALTLPDICGAIEYPQFKKVKTNGIITNRYTKWFDDFVGEDYKVYKEFDPSSLTYQDMLKALLETSHHLEQLSDYRYVQTFLTGFECYVLRCKYLHEGLGNSISNEKIKDILDGFIFTRPEQWGYSHNNLIISNGNTMVQLQVDVFASGIAKRAREWWNARTDKDLHADKFLRIDNSFPVLGVKV